MEIRHERSRVETAIVGTRDTFQEDQLTLSEEQLENVTGGGVFTSMKRSFGIEKPIAMKMPDKTVDIPWKDLSSGRVLGEQIKAGDQGYTSIAQGGSTAGNAKLHFWKGDPNIYK